MKLLDGIIAINSGIWTRYKPSQGMFSNNIGKWEKLGDLEKLTEIAIDLSNRLIPQRLTNEIKVMNQQYPIDSIHFGESPKLCIYSSQVMKEIIYNTISNYYQGFFWKENNQ